MKITGKDAVSPGRGGFSLMEVIVVSLILAIAIVPMILSFTPARRAVGAERRLTVFTNRARGTLNRVRAEDYTTLLDHAADPVNLGLLFGSADEAARESFVLDGSNYVPNVVVQDISGSTGGLLEIVVTLEDVTFRALKAEY